MRDLSVVIRKMQSGFDTLKEAAISPKVVRSINSRRMSGATSFDFAVYFADSGKLLYQLDAWLRPFEQLEAAGMNIILVLKSPTVALAMAEQSSLPILVTRSMATIESFISSHEIAGVFYVNNSQANFTALRMTGPAHIHLNHGESEKSSMLSNQIKAYDYAFIAGNAAEERIMAHIKGVHRSALIKIGRPQLDVADLSEPDSKAGARSTILYAPTWEGDSKDMAYSSITTVGVRLVNEVLADGRYTLVFRPHPKTGSWSQDAAKALKNIKSQIKAAKASDPSAGHRVDETEDPCTSIMRSTVVVADVSAMAMDAIGLNRRLLLLDGIAGRHDYAARNESPTMAKSVPSVTPDFNGSFADLLGTIIDSQIPAGQEQFRVHVFGESSLGTGTRRFVEACEAIKASGEPDVS